MSTSPFSADLQVDLGTDEAAQAALATLSSQEVHPSCEYSASGSVVTVHVHGGSSVELRENLDVGFALYSSIT
jgi:hypothetical protein